MRGCLKMKSQVLNKIAVAINKIVDWGIDLAYATAHIVYLVINRMYRELKTRKGRAYSLRVLLGILFIFVVVEIYTTEKNYLNPLVKAWEDDKVRIEELERKLNEANDKMYELEEYRQGLLQGDKEAIVTYIKHKFGDKSDLALAVADCESHLRSNAVGDGHLTFSVNGREYGKSYGVFQIRHLQGRPDPEYLLNAKNNIDYAYEMYEKQGGFQAWTCYSAGYYQKHLTSL